MNLEKLVEIMAFGAVALGNAIDIDRVMSSDEQLKMISNCVDSFCAESGRVEIDEAGNLIGFDATIDELKDLVGKKYVELTNKLN